MVASSSGRTRNSTYYFQDCQHFPANYSVQIFKTGWSTTHVSIRFTPPDLHPPWGQAHASASSVFDRWISRYSSDAHVMNCFMLILLYFAAFAQLLPCRFSNLSHLSLLSLDSVRYFVPELFLWWFNVTIVFIMSCSWKSALWMDVSVAAIYSTLAFAKLWFALASRIMSTRCPSTCSLSSSKPAFQIWLACTASLSFRVVIVLIDLLWLAGWVPW